jgi:putative nucleotide binding protein
MKEETCFILDFLPSGYPNRRHAEPIAQAIGVQFSLLELVPKKDVSLKPEEEVYIGEGKREKIRYIKGRIRYSDLTNYAQTLLPTMIEKIVQNNEQRFVQFFNTATMFTPRMHKLQILPGIGKKHVVSILEERKKKPFESFEDVSNRVKLCPNPVKIIAKRILEELKGKEKFNLFVPMYRRP